MKELEKMNGEELITLIIDLLVELNEDNYKIAKAEWERMAKEDDSESFNDMGKILFRLVEDKRSSKN